LPSKAIQASADALLRIIDDILDFSKMEVGFVLARLLTRPASAVREVLSAQAQSREL
jgi:signal transduction histidine kinase